MQMKAQLNFTDKKVNKYWVHYDGLVHCDGKLLVLVQGSNVTLDSLSDKNIALSVYKAK